MSVGVDLEDIGRIFGQFDSAREHEAAITEPHDLPKKLTKCRRGAIQRWG